MNKFEMTLWLAQNGLNYEPAKIDNIPEWATSRVNGHQFIPDEHKRVRIKPEPDRLPKFWDPLENMSDAWLLIEEAIRQGASPGLFFDDNLIEDEGMWTCTADGMNSVPDPDDPDDTQIQFSHCGEYWYPTPELAICAFAALGMEKILVQEEEDRYELYDKPPVEITPEMQKLMNRLLSKDMYDEPTEEGTPGDNG